MLKEGVTRQNPMPIITNYNSGGGRGARPQTTEWKGRAGSALTCLSIGVAAVLGTGLGTQAVCWALCLLWTAASPGHWPWPWPCELPSVLLTTSCIHLPCSPLSSLPSGSVPPPAPLPPLWLICSTPLSAWCHTDPTLCLPRKLKR